MTNSPYSRQQFTQSSFRRSDGRSQNSSELSTDIDLPPCDSKLKSELKLKVKDVVKDFVDHLLLESKRNDFDDERYLKTLFSKINL